MKAALEDVEAGRGGLGEKGGCAYGWWTLGGICIQTSCAIQSQWRRDLISCCGVEGDREGGFYNVSAFGWSRGGSHREPISGSAKDH